MSEGENILNPFANKDPFEIHNQRMAPTENEPSEPSEAKTEKVPFQPVHPFRYALLPSQERGAATMLGKYYDPENKVRRVNYQFEGSMVNPIMARLLVRDLTHVEGFDQVVKNIEALNQRIEDSSAFKEANCSIEPGPDPESVTVKMNLFPKGRFAGELSQDFDRDGAYLSPKVLTRNRLGFLETITFEAYRSFSASKQSAYTFSMLFPHVLSKSILDISYQRSNRYLNSSAEEQSDGASIEIRRPERRETISITNALRTNHFSEHSVSDYVLKNELVPSRKFSIKYSKIFKDEIDMFGKEMGQYLEGSAELAFTPYATKFLKFDMVHRKFFNFKKIENIRPLEYVNFENAFRAGILIPIGRRPIRMNDRFYQLQSRGFSDIGNRDYPYSKRFHPNVGEKGYEFLGDHVGNDLFLANTTKLNLYKYPVLSKVNATPFLHLSWFYLPGQVWQSSPLERKNTFKENLRVSAGLGIGLAIHGKGKLEVLYNFFHKSRNCDTPATAQFKVSFND